MREEVASVRSKTEARLHIVTNQTSRYVLEDGVQLCALLILGVSYEWAHLGPLHREQVRL